METKISEDKQLSFDLLWVLFRSSQFGLGHTPFLISVTQRKKASDVGFQEVKSSSLQQQVVLQAGCITDTSCDEALVLVKREG